MRLGIFGGTFDPVHYGHLLLAECCREQCRLDAVWFLPAATAPHKRDREPTPAGQRIEMLELATAGNPAFSVCRYEADRGGVNFTVDTLAHFHAEDPSRELFFLLGADMLLDLPHWREAARVCELAVPVAVCRPGAGPIDFDCLGGIASRGTNRADSPPSVEMPEIGVSSTDIRRRVQAGQSIRYRVPRAVEKYIETQGCSAGPESTGEANGLRYAALRILSSQAQLVRHGHGGRFGLAAERFKRQLELLVGAEIEIEEEELSAAELAPAAAVAAETLGPNGIAQRLCQVQRLVQQRYRRHPSPLPVSRTSIYRLPL